MHAEKEVKSVFVTGASSGIGRALAERFASRGAKVGLAARRRRELDEAAARVRELGGEPIVIELDAGDTAAVVAAVDRADAEIGPLDLVIACAGGGPVVHAKELTWEHAEPILRVNALGAIATLAAALPRMVARKRGQLVGISSLAGQRGLPTSAAYSAAKAALSTFIESLRVDLAGSGVFVTDVRPGFVATAATANAKFPLPMLMQLDEAVDLIVAGIDAHAPIVSFPKPLAGALAASRLLPNFAFDSLVRRLSKA